LTLCGSPSTTAAIEEQRVLGPIYTAIKEALDAAQRETARLRKEADG
jgi:hypothetical protein